jgi:hypothetical protein
MIRHEPVFTRQFFAGPVFPGLVFGARFSMFSMEHRTTIPVSQASRKGPHQQTSNVEIGSRVDPTKRTWKISEIAME